MVSLPSELFVEETYAQPPLVRKADEPKISDTARGLRDGLGRAALERSPLATVVKAGQTANIIELLSRLRGAR